MSAKSSTIYHLSEECSNLCLHTHSASLCLYQNPKSNITSSASSNCKYSGYSSIHKSCQYLICNGWKTFKEIHLSTEWSNFCFHLLYTHRKLHSIVSVSSIKSKLKSNIAHNVSSNCKYPKHGCIHQSCKHLKLQKEL